MNAHPRTRFLVGAQPTTLIGMVRRLLAVTATLVLFASALTGAARADGEMYFADIFYPDWSDGHVYRANTDGSGLEEVLSVGGGLRGFAVDAAGGKFYWSDVSADVIRRANLDGSGVEDLVTSGLAWPMAIALDPAGDLMAWGDQTLEQIGTAHLDGTNAAPLLNTPFASGIAIDPTGGKLYWTTAYTGTSGDILRANFDGTSIDTVVTGVDRPGRIALDTTAGKIYWTDYVVDMVRRANFDGSGVEDLYNAGGNLNPDGIGLDLAAGKVYWGQSVANNVEVIMCMNLDGTDPETVLTGGFGIIMDIAVLSGTAGVAGDRAITPRLLPAQPNPSRTGSTLRLILPESQLARITIHDIAGRQVATLVDAELSAGEHAFLWDGRQADGSRVPAGTYFCRTEAGTQCRVQPIRLIR